MGTGPAARKTTAIILLGAIFALTAAACLSAADLALELPAVIEAREGSFYLGEYAKFEGDESISGSASMALITPVGGKFGVSDVIEALSGTAVSERSVAIRMPESVTVLPESRAVSLLREMTSWKWRIEVEGHADANGDFTLPPRVLPGARSVSLKLAGPDGRRANKQVKLRWYQPVVFSDSVIAKDVKIDVSALKLRIETVGMTTPLVWDVSQLANATPRRDIRAGDAIAQGDVEEAMIVRNGSSVRLIAKVRGLGVETPGIALQRGGMGDVIKVKNLSSRKILSGTVIGVGRVQIVN
jgi:flagella basal body P-ring formation protein FlgA